MKKLHLAFAGSLLLLMFGCKKAGYLKKQEEVWTVTTLAGSNGIGYMDGIGKNAAFQQLDNNGIVADDAGNIYISDPGNQCIRKIAVDGMVTTFAGMTGVTGNTDGPAASATFNDMKGLALDAAGNLYVADAGNSLIRKITPGGIVSTIA